MNGNGHWLAVCVSLRLFRDDLDELPFEIDALPPQAAAVAEACDIISDYDAACQSAARMTARYETPALAIKKDDFGYCCPTCGRWIRVPDSWCHWCGQRIEWDAITRDRYKEERNQRRTHRQ